jgi:phage/plasmid-like protein (TIGR03299 family)
MAHELDIRNGKAAIAFVGDKPWHGLGQELSDGASIKTWKTEAGMDWEIQESPVMFNTPAGQQVYNDQKILYRGDTNEQLSIVGDNYKVVQPGEVLEFFRELVGLQGMKLSTAGVLFGGRRFWALAETGRATEILKNDKIKGNLLLTTSCDGTMATSAMFTSVRVCCNNTLRIALGGSQSLVKQTHRVDFDEKSMKFDLGVLDEGWNRFITNISELSEVSISNTKAEEFVYELVKRPNVSAEEQPYTTTKKLNHIMHLFKSGIGNNGNTVWDLLNGITEYADHHSGMIRSPDKKLWNTWFGSDANMKEKAFDLLVSEFI